MSGVGVRMQGRGREGGRMAGVLFKYWWDCMGYVYTRTEHGAWSISMSIIKVFRFEVDSIHLFNSMQFQFNSQSRSKQTSMKV